MRGGGLPERQIALISNPLTRMWSDRAAGQLNVSFEWLSSPDYDYEDMKRSCARMGAIMEYHLEMSRSDEFKRIIEDVLKGHRIKKGENQAEVFRQWLSAAAACGKARRQPGLLHHRGRDRQTGTPGPG